jgi:membrane-associated phospholipid phosphatase
MHKPLPRSRASIPILVVAATSAFLPVLAAGNPGFSLDLARTSAGAFELGPGSLLPSPANLGLGVDPDALGSIVAADSAPRGVATPAAPPAHAEWTVPSLGHLPRRIGNDFKALVTQPLRFDSRDWTRFALGVGAVGVAAAFDARLRDAVQARSGASTRNLAKRMRPLGAWGGVATMGVLLGVGELTHDANLASTGADGLEASLFAGGVITPVLKELTGRPRPNAGLGSGDFEPVSRAQSFPSGEATEAFTLAAVVSRHATSPVVRGLAWGLAGLVGWERMVLDAHWASDVVAGALIGTTVGAWVSDRSRAEMGGHPLSVQPMVGPGVVGVSGSLSW